VVEKAQEAAVEEARNEALTTTIATVTAQLAAQHSQATDGEGMQHLCRVYSRISISLL